MNFDHIILEEEQKELFIRIVETRRKTPRYQWEIMYMIKGYPDLTIVSKNGKNFKINDITDGDIDELVIKGLLRLIHESTDEKHFTIPKEGFLYYEWLMKQQGKPIERIEKSILKYIELDPFKSIYSKAYKELKQAEVKLWDSDSQDHLTAIGHHCRDAMQEFAEQLYRNVFGKIPDGNKAETIKTLRTILDKKEIEMGNTVKPFLEALLAYWGTVSDLVQRQEHGAQKEGEPLTWEDARRVVFQTVNVMVELDRTVGNKE